MFSCIIIIIIIHKKNGRNYNYTVTELENTLRVLNCIAIGNAFFTAHVNIVRLVCCCRIMVDQIIKQLY